MFDSKALWHHVLHGIFPVICSYIIALKVSFIYKRYIYAIEKNFETFNTKIPNKAFSLQQEISNNCPCNYSIKCKNGLLFFQRMVSGIFYRLVNK